MDITEELRKLAELRDKGLLDENEFQHLKRNLIEKVTNSGIGGNHNVTVGNLERTKKKSTLTLRYGGVGGLIDSKIKMLINNELHSKNSIIHGFSHKIDLTSKEVEIKFVALFKSTTINLTNLDINKSYEVTFEFDSSWGKMSKKYQIREV